MALDGCCFLRGLRVLTARGQAAEGPWAGLWGIWPCFCRPPGCFLTTRPQLLVAWLLGECADASSARSEHGNEGGRRQVVARGTGGLTLSADN